MKLQLSATAFAFAAAPLWALAQPSVQSASYTVELTATRAALERAGVPSFAAAGVAQRAFAVGTITDRVARDGLRISATSTLTTSGAIGSLFRSAGYTRSTAAMLSGGLPQTQSFTDARPGKPTFTTRVDAVGRTIALGDGTKAPAKSPLKTAVVDMLALQYAYIGTPEAIKPFRATLATGRSLNPASFGTLRESITVAGTSVAVIRLYREVRGSEAGIEIWYRASDGLPVMTRISLSAKYGATLSAKIKELPR